MKRRLKRTGRIRKVVRWAFLVLTGILVGLIVYEMIMLWQVTRLRSYNPASTSLIDTRIQEARTRGLK